MRPLWNGSISFGLVNIPVRMYSAVESRDGIDFTMLHKQDSSPVRYARICRQDGKEIEWDDIVKGYEYAEGTYVVFTPEQLAELGADKSATIDIQQFVKEGDIDIRYFDKPYYLEVTKGGEKAYALLRKALQQAKMAALVTYVSHERQHLGVITPVGKLLVLTQMRFPSDIRSGDDLTKPAAAVSDAEVDVALKLIKQGTKPFIPEDFHDTYTEELERRIKAQLKGTKPAPSKKSTVDQPADADDLMSALKASLAGTKK